MMSRFLPQTPYGPVVMPRSPRFRPYAYSTLRKSSSHSPEKVIQPKLVVVKPPVQVVQPLPVVKPLAVVVPVVAEHLETPT